MTAMVSGFRRRGGESASTTLVLSLGGAYCRCGGHFIRPVPTVTVL